MKYFIDDQIDFLYIWKLDSVSRNEKYYLGLHKYYSYDTNLDVLTQEYEEGITPDTQYLETHQIRIKYQSDTLEEILNHLDVIK